jgi:hypothetical protein
LSDPIRKSQARSRAKAARPKAPRRPTAPKASTSRKLAKKSLKEDAFKAPPAALAFESATSKREAEILYETWIKNERKMGMENLWYFVTRQLFPGSMGEHYSPGFHQDICDELQALRTGEARWWIVPREHRKSYIITMAHSVWRILKDPNIRILVLAEKKEITGPFSRLVRSAFVAGTPAFKHFQTIWHDHIWNEGEGTHNDVKQAAHWNVKKRTQALADPTFRASYVGISAAWRCDILVYDDAVSKKNSSNPDMSRQTLNHMMSALPMLATKSKYRMILGVGTRYAYHDPYSYIIGDDTGEQADTETTSLIKERFLSGRTRIMVRHAFEHPTQPCTRCPEHIMKMSPHGEAVMPQDGGLPLCPDIIPEKVLLERFQDYLMNPELGESAFWHQYMNLCMAPKNQKFKAEWFHYVTLPYFPSHKKRVLAIDSAHKDMAKEVGDYMVAIFAEFDSEGRCLLVQMLRSNQWTRDEFTRRIVSFCKLTNWWPTMVTKEKFGEDPYLVDVGRAFLEHHHPVHLHVAPKRQDQSKNDFIAESLQGPFERGEIVFGKMISPEHFQRAKYELTNLGQTVNDDVGDCMALLMNKDVRVRMPIKPIGSADAVPWTCPTLDLYDPNRVAGREDALNPPEGPTNPLELAFSKNAELRKFVVDEFGDNITLNWDPTRTESHGFSWGENE